MRQPRARPAWWLLFLKWRECVKQLERAAQLRLQLARAQELAAQPQLQLALAQELAEQLQLQLALAQALAAQLQIQLALELAAQLQLLQFSLAVCELAQQAAL